MDFNKLINVINAGGIAIIPTDTVYGIGCDSLNIRALKNLYDIENSALVHHIDQSLKANYGMQKDVDYMVENFLPKSNSRPWVDKVRQLGNDSAHKYVIAEQERAKVSIKFLEAILKNG